MKVMYFKTLTLGKFTKPTEVPVDSFPESSSLKSAVYRPE